jgi:hypothetical protein
MRVASGIGVGAAEGEGIWYLKFLVINVLSTSETKTNQSANVITVASGVKP